MSELIERPCPHRFGLLGRFLFFPRSLPFRTSRPTVRIAACRHDASRAAALISLLFISFLARVAHAEGIWCVAWAPTTNKIITGSLDESVQVWCASPFRSLRLSSRRRSHPLIRRCAQGWHDLSAHAAVHWTSTRRDFGRHEPRWRTYAPLSLPSLHHPTRRGALIAPFRPQSPFPHRSTTSSTSGI